jgi:hypothetical protein
MLLRALELVLARRRRRGSSPLWTAITVAVFLLRLYQRRSEHQEVSLREELQPGESLLITHTTQPRG